MSHQPGYPGAPAPGQYGQPHPRQHPAGHPGVPGYGAPQLSPYGTPAAPQSSPYGTQAAPAVPQYFTPGTSAAPQSSPYGAPTAPHPSPYGAPSPAQPAYGAPPAANPYGAQAPPADTLWATFSMVAGADQKIDAVELCKCLTQSGFTGSYKPFTQETCKIMITLLDRDRSGKMEFPEFKELWAVLQKWKLTFEQLDKDHSGSLDEQELKSAISSFGFSLSATALNVIMKRYNTNGKIYFDDFIALTIRVRSLSNFFIARDTHRQGYANLAYDDFMTHTMSC